MTLGPLTRAIRSIRENLYLSGVSAGVIGAALILIGAFGLALVNLRAVVSAWERDAHVSAYLKPEIAPEVHASLRAVLEARPEVAAVRYISTAEAEAWMRTEMPEVGPALDELGAGVLPASMEITLRDDQTSEERLTAFVTSLRADGVYADVDYGKEWVARLDAFVGVLTALGAGLGVIVSIAAFFLVNNTIHLVVYSRRDELEVTRLVGATDAWIVTPFLIEGAAHGVAGGLGALLGLLALHRGVLLRLDETFALALGATDIQFLPTTWAFGLLATGVVVGVGGSWFAVRQFLARLP